MAATVKPRVLQLSAFAFIPFATVNYKIAEPLSSEMLLPIYVYFIAIFNILLLNIKVFEIF